MNIGDYNIGTAGNTPNISGVTAFLFVCLHGTSYKIKKEKSVPYYKRKDLKLWQR